MIKIKRSLGERIFEKFNVLFMLLIAFIMAYPLLYVILAFIKASRIFRTVVHNDEQKRNDSSGLYKHTHNCFCRYYS